MFIPFGPDLDMSYVQSWNVAHPAADRRPLAGVGELSGEQEQQLWNTTAVNPSLILTPAVASRACSPGRTPACSRTHVHAVQQTANINQRRELRLWAAQNNPALLNDARLFANIDEYRSDSDGQLPRAC